MRLAALSDIHGNNLALQAVLEDIGRRGGVDQIVVCGDLFVYCADPLGVLEWVLQQSNVTCLMGNTDRYLLEGRLFNLAEKEDWQREILGCFPWTKEQIGLPGLRFLRQLPRCWQFSCEGRSPILFVHGSPRSDEEGIYFDAPEVVKEAFLAGVEADLVVCGHTHLPFIARTARGQTILNLGSVGLPFDGDPRACYAMIEWEESLRIEIRRVAYDIEKAVRQVWDVGLPGAAVTVENMVQARPKADGRPIYGPTTVVSPNRELVPLALGSSVPAKGSMIFRPQEVA